MTYVRAQLVGRDGEVLELDAQDVALLMAALQGELDATEIELEYPDPNLADSVDPVDLGVYADDLAELRDRLADVVRAEPEEPAP